MSEDFRETLYTVDKQGRRVWVYNSVVRGAFFRKRVVVISALLVFYLSMPWLTVDGKQAILLDIANRKFVFFGVTFWATDSRFLALTLGALAMTLFFVTAFVGRAWCGWACPETVFLDFLFRPIEALIEGSAAQRRRLDEGPWNREKVAKKSLKYLVFSALAWLIASTFLAYFVGREPLLRMMAGSPADNLPTFIMTVVLMALMLFQFGWFREQFCTVLCPYARFQSVLMDANTVLVGYDARRGEPRGRMKQGQAVPEKGDCVDCGLCVRVCPTGIDIRNGTQLECIHCAACVDACDSIMTKVARPTGLIRYDTENSFRGGERKIFGIRVRIYGALLIAYFCAFAYFLSVREVSEFQLIRSVGDSPFSILADDRVLNHFKLHISNKGDRDELYRVEVSLPDVQVITPLSPFPVKGGENGVAPVFFNFPRKLLAGGKLELEAVVSSEGGYRATQKISLLGPDSQ